MGHVNTVQAPDIADLERMLNEGGSADEINSRAIEIFERLEEEARRAKRNADVSAKGRVIRDAHDFDRVMKQIEARKHPIFLEKFKKYLNDST
jgi:hypothetical protein